MGDLSPDPVQESPTRIGSEFDSLQLLRSIITASASSAQQRV